MKIDDGTTDGVADAITVDSQIPDIRYHVHTDLEPVRPKGGWWPVRLGMQPVLRVTAKDCGAGFFALLLYALNQIIWAEDNGYAPHVFFGAHCRDGRLNRYYSAERGDNMWEYYFMPASSARTTSTSFQLSQKQLFGLHHLATASIQTYPHGVHRNLKVPRWRYDEGWHRRMRITANRVLTRYVRIRAEPLKVARAFYEQHILARGSRSLLGLHLRGTDKMRNIGGRIVPPSEYYPLIEFYLTKRPDALLLVATDSPAFLRTMEKRYRGRLVAYSALRSERNAFADRSIADNYRKGEDALVDSLLLSCANVLIKPASALSEFSVYFNPALHNHTIELQYQVGALPPTQILTEHLDSERERLRDFHRCAPAMAPPVTP